MEKRLLVKLYRRTSLCIGKCTGLVNPALKNLMTWLLEFNIKALLLVSCYSAQILAVRTILVRTCSIIASS
jgi:hypothetical protein